MDAGLGEVMAKQNPKAKKRLFSGLGYREVQRANSERRSLLPKQQQAWLKAQGYRNVGWENVIALYQKINELDLAAEEEEESLEDLFIKADRIGNKYQSPEEIADFQRQLSTYAQAIAEEIDRQYPEEEGEFVDYSQAAPSAKRKTRSQPKTNRRRG